MYILYNRVSCTISQAELGSVCRVVNKNIFPGVDRYYITALSSHPPTHFSKAHKCKPR